MSERYDVVVIGAGHNGLAAACILAAKGQRVVVVERRECAGGLAESVEFAPGFRSGGVWHAPGNVVTSVLAEIGLRDLRFADQPMAWAIAEPGQAVPFTGPVDRTAFTIAQRYPAEGRNYARYRGFLKRVQPVLDRFLTRRPLNILEVEREAPVELIMRALGLRMLGSKDMVELLRVAPMPVIDFLGEYFEADHLRAALSMESLLGTFTAPRSPGTTLNQIVNESMAGVTVGGGGAALTEALLERARLVGVQFKFGSAVRRIIVDDGKARGVELDNGLVVEAKAVSASCNPKSVLLDMLPATALTHTTEYRASQVRCRGTAAQLLIALDGLVDLAPGAAEEPVQRARIAPSAEYVERAFDAIKYGQCPEHPVLDLWVPTIESPALAPAGKSVLNVLVSYVPTAPDEPWSDASRQALVRSTIDTIERYVPGLGKRVLAAVLSTPADLEADYGLPGGQLHHGEPAIDQTFVRPIPECFDHQAPIAGLTLCGSGTHPGGSIACLAGLQGGQAALRSLKVRAAA